MVTWAGVKEKRKPSGWDREAAATVCGQDTRLLSAAKALRGGGDASRERGLALSAKEAFLLPELRDERCQSNCSYPQLRYVYVPTTAHPRAPFDGARRKWRGKHFFFFHADTEAQSLRRMSLAASARSGSTELPKAVALTRARTDMRQSADKGKGREAGGEATRRASHLAFQRSGSS